MKIPTLQEFKAFAEAQGWSPDFAEGFFKGESSRRCGAGISAYGMVGLDEYCLGFRAGYFERRNTAAECVGIPPAPERVAQNVRLGAIA